MLINFFPADATAIGGCHHSRSHEFYCQSILHPTGYLGYLCESYEFFKAVSIPAQELWAVKKIIQVSTLMVGPAMCTEHLDAGGWALVVWFGRRMSMVRHSGSINYSALKINPEAQVMSPNRMKNQTNNKKKKTPTTTAHHTPRKVLSLNLHAKST